MTTLVVVEDYKRKKGKRAPFMGQQKKDKSQHEVGARSRRKLTPTKTPKKSQGRV